MRTPLSEELFNESQKTLAAILKIPVQEIKMESSLLDDLGIDSVDFWDMLAAFSKKYKINVTEKELVNLNTVSDLVKILESKITIK